MQTAIIILLVLLLVGCVLIFKKLKALIEAHRINTRTLVTTNETLNVWAKAYNTHIESVITNQESIVNMLKGMTPKSLIELEKATDTHSFNTLYKGIIFIIQYMSKRKNPLSQDKIESFLAGELTHIELLED